MRKSGRIISAISILLSAALFFGCDGGRDIGNSDGGTNSTTAAVSETEQDDVSAATNEVQEAADMEITAKVTITNGKFTVGGKELFINGVNTPWENWNDFGGNYNASFWDSHFKDLHEIGVNAVRVWVNCDSMVGIRLKSSDGTVSKVTKQHWNDLDSLFEIAGKHQIYLMPTLLSFDHFKSRDCAELWRGVITDDTARQSFIENYIVPFTERYGDNPYLLGIDLMNEPDWVHENEECGQLSLNALSKFFAECTAAIHQTNPTTLVTVGIGMIKYNSDKFEGNMISDRIMKRYGGDAACVDFYSTHYYDWMKSWTGCPFDMSPTAFGLDGEKPSILGETRAEGGETLVGLYEKSLKNGWDGVMLWTSNEGSAHADNWNDIVEAVGNIEALIPDKVFPLGKK